MMRGCKAAALMLAASAIAGASRAHAQTTQPPPFGDQAAQPAPSRPVAPPAAAPPPAPRPEARPPPPAPGADDDIDDPKVSRRLGKRITVPPAPPPAASPAPPRAASPASPPAASPAPAPARRAAPPPPVPAPVEPIAPPPPAAEADASAPTLVHTYRPPAEEPFRFVPPRLKFAWRHFNFVQIGSSPSPDGLAARESFNSVGFDVYPVSSLVRIGLSSAFGWQSGTFLVDGDYFATQSFSLGAQYRDLGRVIPFAEAFTGVGYLRRLQFDRTVPTAFWQFGADAGIEVYAARVGYLSFAIGYLRPVNGFAKRQQFTTVFVDTWSFKLGIGI